MPKDKLSALFSSNEAATFRAVLDAVPHPIFVKDEQTRFVVVNEMMCSLMRHTFEELIGKTDFDFVPMAQAEVFRGNDLRVLSTGEINENEELLTGDDGKLRTIVTRKKCLALPNGRRLLVGCITDISDFRRTEALVRYHAEHDALTDLPNRRLLAEKMATTTDWAERHAGAYAVLLIDLDRFKPVNDIHGHTAGDAVLCEIATRLQTVVRAGDVVARIGGDEFAVLSESTPASDTSADAACGLAARLIDAIQQPIRIDDQLVEVSASVGISQFPADGGDAESLLRYADVAMYRAKRDGKGRYCFFEQGMDDEIRDLALLEADLRRAILDWQIRPYYQPLMSLSDGRVVGFEILARWEHPQRGSVPPEVFIPIAERLALISHLTFSLLRTACNDARNWPEDLVLALNISPLQLSDSILPLEIRRILAEAGFPPSRLEIEITESALVNDLPMAKSIVGSFRNLGMKVALDDFGTGSSSMFHLSELRFDKIKIDRSFIQTMGVNPESAKIVASILGLTRSLGLSATAEGIEDEEALAHMIDSGCQFGQGFHFGKAVPAAEASKLIVETAEHRATNG